MIGFFEESEGQKSSTRLIFIIGSFWNMLISSALLLYLKTEPLTVTVFFTTIEACLVGLKLYQKTQENKPTE